MEAAAPCTTAKAKPPEPPAKKEKKKEKEKGPQATQRVAAEALQGPEA